MLLPVGELAVMMLSIVVAIRIRDETKCASTNIGLKNQGVNQALKNRHFE
jgi:hypothetical protein